MMHNCLADHMLLREASTEAGKSVLKTAQALRCKQVSTAEAWNELHEKWMIRAHAVKHPHPQFRHGVCVEAHGAAALAPKLAHLCLKALRVKPVPACHEAKHQHQHMRASCWCLLPPHQMKHPCLLCWELAQTVNHSCNTPRKCAALSAFFCALVPHKSGRGTTRIAGHKSEAASKTLTQTRCAYVCTCLPAGSPRAAAHNSIQSRCQRTLH